MNLKGKVAIVTGVSKGIGLAITQALLEKGCKVAGWGRSKPAIEHPDFFFVQTDIRDIEKVTDAFEETVGEFGNLIDILINNAGLGHFDEIENLDVEEWLQMFDTNVHGIFYTTRLVVPLMKQEKRGHIINISSIAGLNGVAYGTGYSATKFAVRGLSQALYQEVKPMNIKVTCVYPGSVNTNFFDEFEGVTANDTMLSAKDVAAMIINVLQTPDNFNTPDLEIRPMNVKYQ